jgi:predicted protein tyrosine phosphatase
MKVKVLFVCTINRMRSLTANSIYNADQRFEVKSAGTSKYAQQPITEDLLGWADFIIVMEKHHRNKIRSVFPDIYRTKRIICLYIPDEYDYMQPELVTLLQSKFESIYTTEIAPDGIPN